MLQYVDVIIKFVITLNLSYLCYNLFCFNKIYKLLYSKMNDLTTIINSDVNNPSTTNDSSYKDRLCGIVAAGDSKKYFGKEYTIKDIESLTPADQEKLFNRYQVKFGKEVVTTVGNSILSLYARAIGLATPADILGIRISLNSEENLTNDLNNDPIISNSLAYALSEICYKYGVYLSPLIATLITTKHLSFNKSTTNKNTYIINNSNDNYASGEGASFTNSTSSTNTDTNNPSDPSN